MDDKARLDEIRERNWKWIQAIYRDRPMEVQMIEQDIPFLLQQIDERDREIGELRKYERWFHDLDHALSIEEAERLRLMHENHVLRDALVAIAESEVADAKAHAKHVLDVIAAERSNSGC